MEHSQKEEYISFLNHNKDKIPIFYHPEWLDAVCGNNWNGLVYKNKRGDIEAVFPYHYYSKFGQTIIKMPKQTPFLGIWFKNKFDKNYKNYDSQEKIITFFIEKLPKFLFFQIRFAPKFRNHQPFYWHKFNQTTQYTYILNEIKNHETLFANFKGNIRTDIRKAEKLVTILQSEDINLFYQINKLSFSRQNMNIKYSFELVKNIDNYLKKLNQRIILFAKDKENNIHAAAYIFWDCEKAYYLWGGADPKFRNSNAQIFLLWEAIKISSQFVDKFDFEGSMIENVAKVFRKFDAQAVPYHRIFKINNKFLKIYQSIK